MDSNESLKLFIKDQLRRIRKGHIYLHSSVAMRCDWKGVDVNRRSEGPFKYNFKVPFTHIRVDERQQRLVLIVRDIECIVNDRKFKGEFQLHVKEGDSGLIGAFEHYYYLSSELPPRFGEGHVTSKFLSTTPDFEMKFPEEWIFEIYHSFEGDGSLTKKAL